MCIAVVVMGVFMTPQKNIIQKESFIKNVL